MTSVSSVDDWSDHIFINTESFVQPSALYYGNGSKDFKDKSLPEKFDPKKYKVEQLYAISKDGTPDPIFSDIKYKYEKKNSMNPTLLYGYGGFQISQTPSYLGSFARQWLDSGRVYVIANIRGGGEFGPQWHPVSP